MLVAVFVFFILELLEQSCLLRGSAILRHRDMFFWVMIQPQSVHRKQFIAMQESKKASRKVGGLSPSILFTPGFGGRLGEIIAPSSPGLQST